jgi:RNA polymerase sigma-70 factor (ECF subfamily)
MARPKIGTKITETKAKKESKQNNAITGGAGTSQVPTITAESYGQRFADGGYKKTVRHLLALGANWDFAHEIAEAAWTRGWERMSLLRDEKLLQAWVNRIARNLMISALRRDWRMTPLEPAHEVESVAEIDTSAIDANLLLKGCAPGERRLLEAYYLRGYSAPEIATKLRKSPGAVHTALHRARRALRERANPKVA